MRPQEGLSNAGYVEQKRPVSIDPWARCRFLSELDSSLHAEFGGWVVRHRSHSVSVAVCLQSLLLLHMML